MDDSETLEVLILAVPCLQIRLDTATIGQYLVSGGEHSNRCPDGWMQVWEGDQPVLHGQDAQRPRPGAWCGASVNPRFYYAEAASVTFVVRLLAIPAGLLAKASASAPQQQQQQQHPVLDLNYKLLPRSGAIVR